MPGAERRRPYEITSSGRAALTTTINEMRTLADEGAHRLGLALRALRLLESGTTSVGADRLMTKQIERLLKWYPSRWRARYGEELGALMEDTYGAGLVPLSSRARVMRSGIAERVRQLGLGGAGDSPSESVRSGSLLVLCGWALFVIAGSAFAKMTEHWVGATPGPDRRLPVGAFGTIQVAAGVGLAFVVIGCAVALPTALRFLREGGWERARRPVLRGLVVSSTALFFTAALVGWKVQHRGSLSDHGGLLPTLAGSRMGSELIAASVGFGTLCGDRGCRSVEILATRASTRRTARGTADDDDGRRSWCDGDVVGVDRDARTASTGRATRRVSYGCMPGTPTEILIALLLIGGLVPGCSGGRLRVFHSWVKMSRPGGYLLDGSPPGRRGEADRALHMENRSAMQRRSPVGSSFVMLGSGSF